MRHRKCGPQLAERIRAWSHGQAFESEQVLAAFGKSGQAALAKLRKAGTVVACVGGWRFVGDGCER